MPLRDISVAIVAPPAVRRGVRWAMTQPILQDRLPHAPWMTPATARLPGTQLVERAAEGGRGASGARGGAGAASGAAGGPASGAAPAAASGASGS